MKWLLLLLIFCASGTIHAQSTLSTAEWFLDRDPGLGNGTSLSLSGASDSLGWMIELDTVSLGVHHLFVRVKDQQGLWSPTHTRSFLVIKSPVFPAGQSLLYCEWFIDEDPGYKNGNRLPTIGLQDSITFSIDISQLAPGVHYLFTRFLDSSYGWSTTLHRAFLVVRPQALPGEEPVVLAEWFLDEDPGFGKANAVPWNNNLDSINLSIDLTGLDPGVHYLMLRVMDSVGQWGHVMARSFLISPAWDDPIASINYRFTNGVDELAFSYVLDKPENQLEIDLGIDVPLLIQKDNYQLCLSVETASGKRSTERCYSSVLVNNQAVIQAPSVNIFPNPASDRINLKWGSDFQPKNLILFNSSGRQIRQARLDRVGGVFSLDLDGLASGTYTLVLEGEGKMAVKPVIVLD